MYPLEVIKEPITVPLVLADFPFIPFNSTVVVLCKKVLGCAEDILSREICAPESTRKHNSLPASVDMSSLVRIMGRLD